MKRSKALGLITEIVSEVTYEKLAEERAVRILTAIEEAGMLPPFSHEEYAKSWKQHRDRELADGNVWEQE